MGTTTGKLHALTLGPELCCEVEVSVRGTVADALATTRYQVTVLVHGRGDVPLPHSYVTLDCAGRAFAICKQERIDDSTLALRVTPLDSYGV